MIEKFVVKNYRSYKNETELSFLASNKDVKQETNPVWYKEVDGKRLLRLLIGVGVNGAGKSKMISALSYLRMIVLYKPEKPTGAPEYRPFLLDDESRSLPTELSLSYYIDDEVYCQYKVSVSSQRIETEALSVCFNRKMANVFTRYFDAERETVVVQFGAVCDLSKENQRALEINTLSNSTVMATFGSMNLESKILKSNYDFFRHKLSVVRRSDVTLAEKLQSGDTEKDEKMKKLVLQLLKDVGTNITDYLVDTGSFSIDDLKDTPDFLIELMKKQYPSGRVDQRVLRFEHTTVDGKKLLDSKLESVGTMNIVILMVVLYDIILLHKTSCVDEIEQGIHTSALVFILYMYLMLSEDSQILIATHDLTILKADFLRRDAVRLFEKDEHGVTTVRRPEYMHRTVNFYAKYTESVNEKVKALMADENIRSNYRTLL